MRRAARAMVFCLTVDPSRAGRTLPQVGCIMHCMREPVRYLSRAEFAERIGVVPGALNRYKLPPPDALTGTIRGWKPATVDRWQEKRPGSGWRKGKTAKKPHTPSEPTDGAEP